MNTASLDLTLISPDANTSFSGTEFWLRLEQEVPEDDNVTTGEISKLVDELYKTDPCIDPVSEEVEEPVERQPVTLESFIAAVKSKWDIAECRRLTSGTYTAKVRVIYSHPNDPNEKYNLKVSRGTVDSIIRTYTEITKTINVKEESGYALEYPVPQRENEKWPGKAKWLGSVFTEKLGAIPPPTITGRENILSWDVPCTGTLIVTVPTVYDLATITVPGIINQVTNIGVSQESRLTAFYHYQAYELDIEMIAEDTTADKETLAAICGWSGLDGGTGTGTGGTDTDGDPADDDPDGDVSDGPELGCIKPAPQMATNKFFRDNCCVDGTGPDCAEYASLKEVKGLDAETMRIIAAGYNNPVEFIAVGPGPDGCGRIITRQNVNRRNCCDEIDPLQADPTNPTSIAPNGSASLNTIDGNLQSEWWWEWRAGGGLTFAGGRTSAQGGKSMTVFAPEEFCASGYVTVDDGCTRLNFTLENEEPPQPLAITDDYTVAPDGYVTVEATGGVEPYQWSSEGLDLISPEEGHSATFQAPSDFCGTATVRVSDACTETASVEVRSTAGEWVQLYDFDNCNPPGKYFKASATEQNTFGINGKYAAQIARAANGFYAGENCTEAGNCPAKTRLTDTFSEWAEMICDAYPEATFSNLCCLYPLPGDSYQHLTYDEYAAQLFEWRCSA